MSDFLEEEVPPVNPLSFKAIEMLANSFLSQFAPDNLIQAMPLDVLNLIDVKLPEYGIHVSPATREELGYRAGATDPKGDSEINILVTEEIWDALEQTAPMNYFAKTTVCHEIGHALLHVPVIRRHMLVEGVLARVQRKSLKAYEDPEWQAWAFAGCIMMPSVTVNKMLTLEPLLNVATLSQKYELSEKMVMAQLKKMKLNLV